MFTKLWLKLNLYFKGIRFYETFSIPKAAEFRRAEFKTVKGHSVTFSFYKEECRDLIFKRGRICEEHFTGYIIQAKFDDNMPSNIYKYNNLKFFFNGKLLSAVNEEAITSMLLAIYLDFIKNEFET